MATENKLLIKESKISFGYLSGRITDLNIWSIPLAAKELNVYAAGCSNDNILESKASLLWSKVTTAEKGPTTREIRVSRDEICIDQNGLKISLCAI